MQFTHYKHRELLLKAFRQKRKMTQLQVGICEDWRERVAKARTGLYQLMKDSIEQGKQLSSSLINLFLMGNTICLISSRRNPFMYLNRTPANDQNANLKQLVLACVH